MKKFLIYAFLLLPIVGYAKTDKTSQQQEEEPVEKKHKVLSGFSGGMAIHVGYSFASNPAELFRNISLEGVPSLSKDGVTLGLGGQLRFHFLDHIHFGGEGAMSIMPLAGESSIRTGWGGAFVDGYVTAGRIRPLIGLGMGGGNINRLFVPSSISDVVHIGDSIAANASYSKTTFFYVDPYLGLEILLGPTKSKSLYIKLDYLLPFGNDKGDVADKNKSWSRFIKPSGPRIYIGLMFGKQKD